MGAGAALFRHHVFVDLETTGLDPRADRVVEVGALFVDRGEVTGGISRLFDPGRPLPQEVQKLTGLADADSAGCPRFEGFLPELRDRLRGFTVVAHNAEFERGFLAGLLEELRAPLLDSCELLHYLHPELPSHSLDALVRWAKVAAGARHRALEDCEDTFLVVSAALDGCVAQGRFDDVLDLLHCLAVEGSAQPPLVELLSDLAELCAGGTAPGRSGGAAGPRSYAEGAPRAYLRAYLRRSKGGDLRGLSSWFRRRYPVLSELETTAGRRRE